MSNNPFDCPGNSPDLNPTENVWAALKKEIWKDKIITNKRDLIENIIKACQKHLHFKKQTKNALPASMP